MLAVRSLLAQRSFATLLCMVTLLLKVVVPTGYMIDSDHGRMTITICSGTGSRTATMDMPAMHGDMGNHGKSTDHGKAEMPCAFSGLSAASLAAADPIQLAALIAFVMAVGLTGLALPPPALRAQLRPPLRGPPTSL